MRSEAERGAALGRVLELTLLLGEDMTQALARDGLTAPRAHLLWELQQRGPSTQQALAVALGVTPRNVTGLVDGLAATGFVTRQPPPTDRRSTLVTFTEHGAAVAEGFERGRAELADLLFTEMADDLFAAFVEGLDVVLDRLRAALAAAGEGAR
jgi:DNA-binding MarR family transcriptional regulator